MFAACTECVFSRGMHTGSDRWQVHGHDKGHVPRQTVTQEHLPLSLNKGVLELHSCAGPSCPQGSTVVVPGSTTVEQGPLAAASCGFTSLHRCLSHWLGGWTFTHDTLGVWTPDIAGMPSNFRELLAVWHVLQSLPVASIQHKTLQVVSDNVMMVACINCLGTSSQVLSDLMKQFLAWASERSIVLVAKHLSGVRNCRADWISCILVHHE